MRGKSALTVCRCRITDHQAGCQQFGAWGGFFAKLCYQNPSGQSPLLGMVLVDGGEGRLCTRRRGNVVETYNGDVLGHGDPPLGHPLDGAECELVARGEDRRRLLMRTEQCLDGQVSESSGTALTLVDGHPRPGQTGLLQRGPVAS